MGDLDLTDSKSVFLIDTLSSFKEALEKFSGLKDLSPTVNNMSPLSPIPLPKKTVKKIFTKSLEKREETYQCLICQGGTSFVNFVSLQKHMRQEHPNSPKLSAESLSKRDTIICLLPHSKVLEKKCNKSVKKLDICRHLKRCHNSEKPPGKQFKGFYRIEPETKFSPQWGNRNEEFPEEEDIEIDGEEMGDRAVIDETPNSVNSKVDDYNDGIDIEIATEEISSSKTNTEVSQSGDQEVDELTPAISITQPVDKPGFDGGLIINEAHQPEHCVDLVPQETMYQDLGLPPETSVAQSAAVTVSVGGCKSVPIKVQQVEAACEDSSDQQTHPTDGNNHIPEASNNKIETETFSTSSADVFKVSEVGTYVDLSNEELDVIDSSPPFHGFSDEAVKQVKQSSLIKNDVLLSSIVDIQNDAQIFEVVVPVTVKDVKDEISSSVLCFKDVAKDNEENIPIFELRRVRYEKRNVLPAIEKLSLKPENQTFIGLFDEWSVACQDASPNTMKLSLGHLFDYPDSFLNYFTSQFEDFTLMKLIAFQDEENFVSVPSPFVWLSIIGGKSGQDSPNRRNEGLKAFKRIISFIKFKLNETPFHGSTILRKQAIKEHIKDILESTQETNYHAKYKMQSDSQNSKRRQMQEILNPSSEEDKLHAIESWFASPERKALDDEGEMIYKNFVARNDIEKKPFNKFANLVYLELALSDKLRVGVYNAMLNSDWVVKVEVYLPAGYVDPEYDKLPPGWRIYSKPSLQPNAKPSRYEIRIPGNRPGMKNKQRQTITLNLRTYELMNRFQDIKRGRFGELNMKSPFFINYDGCSLPPLRNYKGSLLNIVGNVMGIPNFTLKDTRKSLESQIQNKESLKPHIKSLNSHSLEVGKEYYDNMDGARRSLMNNNINLKEGSSDKKRKLSEVSEDIKAKRFRDGEKDKERLIKEAEDYMRKDKKKKPADLSPSALGFEDVSLLVSLFKDVVNGEIYC